MNSPISWMSTTGESISSAIAASIALSSGPTARATRSLSNASRGVGSFTAVAGGASPDDDAVLHLDLSSRREVVKIHHRELVAHLAHLARRDFLIELAEQL